MLTEEKLSILEKTGSADMRDLVAEVRKMRAVLAECLDGLGPHEADETTRTTDLRNMVEFIVARALGR
jgi:hypothetical protein